MAMRPYADLIPHTREVFGKPVMQTVKNLGGIVATCGIILGWNERTSRPALFMAGGNPEGI
jgi:hypothetical protein